MRASPKTDKILIALPFWRGDREQAMILARLLADLEPSYSGAADFLFMARQDCSQDRETVGYVSKKFNTFTAASKRTETGWPQGCNNLFFSVIDWCLRGISSAKIPAYKAIFVCASDSAPLVRDAILYLHSQWDSFKRPVFVAGAMVPTNSQDPDGSHINGDCILLSGNPEFLYWLVKRTGGVLRRGGGWDWVLAPEFQLKGWADIPGIRSHYRRPSFREDEWQPHIDSGIKFVHGVKDDSLLKLARKKLL